MSALPDPSRMFAAEVQYWRLDPKFWRPVLQAAAEAGLPAVSTYVPWEVHEVEPGKFDLQGETDSRRNFVDFLEEVQDTGLQLAYRPGPFCCNEMAWGGLPRRIVTGDPDMMVLQADGTPAPGYRIQLDEGWQPSYLHPRYLAEVRTWFEAVDAVAKEYTAAQGGPITLCNLDNEVSFTARDGMFMADYNPVVVAPGGLYHQWLEQTYHQPESLPYRQTVARFEDVTPPRALGDDVETNLQWYLDWVRFKEWLLARFVATLKSMHQDCGLQGVSYYTNLNPHRPEGVPVNFTRFAEATGGLVGYDFYRAPWLSYSGYSSMARIIRVMNATLPMSWSAEFMSGWWHVNMARTRVTADHTELMATAAMANGCQALNWFMFHDRHNWGDAPVSHMGHRRQNHAAVQKLMARVRQLPDWDSLRPVEDLAVAYYRPYMWHSHLGDPFPCNDNNLHCGAPGLWGSPAGEAVADYEAVYRLGQQAGYTVGAVDLSDAPNKLDRCAVLWFCPQTFVDHETAARLRRFVHRGGTLILTGTWPVRDLAGGELDLLDTGYAPPEPDRDIAGFQLTEYGQGKVVYSADTLASSDPGEENLDLVARIGELFTNVIGCAAVKASRPDVTTMHSSEGNRTEGKAQEHNFVDAVLHRGNNSSEVLYLVNLHERAVDLTLEFSQLSDGELHEIGGQESRYMVRRGSSWVDIDCKCGRVFQVVQ